MAKLKSFKIKTLETLLAIILQQEKLAKIREKIVKSSGEEFEKVSHEYATATVKLRNLNISYMRQTRKDSDCIINSSSTPTFTKEELEKEIERRKANVIWTDERLEEFEMLYPKTPNEDMAAIFGISVLSVSKKAVSLGLTKDKKSLSTQRC